MGYEMREPGWHCTYTPPSRASERRPFDPAKLEEITRRVCEDFGEEAARAAVEAGLSACAGNEGEGSLTCDQIRELESLLDYWASQLDWRLDALLTLQEYWRDIQAALGPAGALLGDPPDLLGVVGFLGSVKDGTLKAQVSAMRASAGCFETGGGF